MKQFKPILVIVCLFFIFQSITAQQPQLLHDIAPGTTNGISYDYAAVASGKYFFVGDSPDYGREVWVSDGSPAGTKLLKDIAPGAESGFNLEFVVFKDKIWFTARNADFGLELWSSDGTEAGTVCMDIAVGPSSSEVRYLTAGTDYLYFKAFDESSTSGLYRTDGVSASPERILTLIGTTMPTFISSMATVGNTVYIAFDGPTSDELWKSDGTVAGTSLVADINPNGFGKIGQLSAVGSKVYFPGSSSLFSDFQPWVSNGVTAIKLADIAPNTDADPKWFYEFKNRVYFSAQNQNLVGALWRTQGTAASTAVFKQMSVSSFYGEPFNFASDANYLYFAGYDLNAGYELWRTDGTSAGTVLVKDLKAGFSSSYPKNMYFANGKLYFSADFEGNGQELCLTDGTAAGTTRVTDFFPNSTEGGRPAGIKQLGNKLLFTAKHPDHGNELFALTLTSTTQTVAQQVAIQLSPNPATDRIQVRIPTSIVPKNGRIKVVNMDGAVVAEYQMEGQEMEVSVEGLSQGIYWLEFTSDGYRGFEKLVVLGH
jgi:ELWxxDGT repeat protein